jgi:Family of unknown function (DUF6176)
VRENPIEARVAAFVREWAYEIISRRDKAIQTLRDESIIVESAFQERSEQCDFLIYYMKARSFEQADMAVNLSITLSTNSTGSSRKIHG